MTLGMLYATANPDAGAFHQPELGERYLARACALNAFACDGLVTAAKTRAECGDFAGETHLLSVACDQHYPPACVGLAYALVDGVDVPRDLEHAARLFGWACDADDRFAEIVETNDEGKPVAHRDPMSKQLVACVASETFGKLGLTPSIAPAKNTPETAQRLDAERREKHRGQWQFEAIHSPTLADLRDQDAHVFSEPADARAARVRASRQSPGGIRLCGNLEAAR